MKKLIALPLVALAMATLSTTSCMEEGYNLDDLKDAGFNITTSVAAPLAKIHANLGDIFNMEAVAGKIVKPDGFEINLKEAGFGEIEKLFPLPIDVEKTKFGATNYIDDIDFDDVFGDKSTVNALDSLVLIMDLKSTMPFDVNLALGFTGEVIPEVDTPEIYPEQLHKELSLDACTDGKTVVSKTVYFRFGNVADYLAKAKAMKVFLGFEVPIEKLPEVSLNGDSFIDIKIKAFVQGSFDANEF